MSFETPESLASELVTFTSNEGDIYRSQIEPMLKNLMTKRARGVYDRDKAVQLFMYLAETGARKYAKTFGGSESGWHDMFPIEVRRIAATHWRDEFESEAATGNYDNLLPKKYQPKAAASPRRQKALTMRSNPAYEAGKAAGRAWCQSADPSKSVLRAILLEESGILKPHEELVREKMPTITKTLGVTAKDARSNNTKFETACRQYDVGYYDACQAILDAMEGN